MEDGTGDVSAPVGVAEEGADEGEEVGGAGPLADVVGGLGVVLVEHPPQEHHKVHPDAEEGARHEPVVSCMHQETDVISRVSFNPHEQTRSTVFRQNKAGTCDLFVLQSLVKFTLQNIISLLLVQSVVENLKSTGMHSSDAWPALLFN